MSSAGIVGTERGAGVGCGVFTANSFTRVRQEEKSANKEPEHTGVENLQARKNFQSSSMKLTIVLESVVVSVVVAREKAMSMPIVEKNERRYASLDCRCWEHWWICRTCQCDEMARIEGNVDRYLELLQSYN